jgi:hypothetical protein
MVKLLSLSLVLFVAWSADPSGHLVAPAEAQQEQDSVEEQARRLFAEGVALARSERWAEALSAFRRSGELVPRASTSYNIANALFRVDRPADALDELDRHAANPDVQRTEEALKREEALRARLLGAVSEVRLTISPADATLFVDGRASSLEGAERVLRLNPGVHSLRIFHANYMTTLRELQLDRGSHESYTVILQSGVPPGPVESAALTITPANADSAPDDRKPFVKRPGFWVMIGAIVVVGAGVGVAVALTRKSDDPQCGTTGSCATTQGLTVKSF